MENEAVANQMLMPVFGVPAAGWRKQIRKGDSCQHHPAEIGARGFIGNGDAANGSVGEHREDQR